MPVYEYECEFSEFIFERIVLVANDQKQTLCMCPNAIRMDSPYYGHKANRIFSLPARINTPEDSKTNTIYFENKRTGEVIISADTNYERKGFEKKVARNHFERLELEKKVQKKDNERLSIEHETRDYIRHHSSSNRHSELNNAINQRTIVADLDGDGEKESITLDDGTADLMKAAMERTNKKVPKRKESSFHLPVNHDNKSTRNSKN